MDGFTHLHVHTEYSLLDGACRIEQLVKQVKELGQTAIAITDHGVMYGAIDFYKACKREGIKPIIGCEVYVAPRTRFDKVYRVDTSPYHLVLLCKDEVGYQNLIHMVSRASTEGFYNRPRVDLDLLREHHEGLICLSACLAGQIPRLLTAGDYDGAKKVALEYAAIFGPEHYYLEVQNHGIEEQQRILPKLVQLSRETGIGLVATNDAHYLRREDSRMQNVLLCIQTNRTIAEGSDMEFPTQEFYIKSRQEMSLALPGMEEALDNTMRIAERCNLEFEFGNTKLPHFTAPDGEDNETYFRRLCGEGLVRIYGSNPSKELTDRLEYELNIISTMGYVDYFLIVYDFIAYAKSKGIPVGPGRGSGAASLAAYCIGITGIDPMKYNLLFERFLNPERISMPDFDIDFCYERRQEVIDYVVEKYGTDHVAQIITFGTMAARGAIRDVGRAMGITYQTVDSIAKLIPSELGITLDRSLEKSEELRRLYESNPQVKELIDMARSIEGMPRHASTHAAGVVITRDPVDHYVPLQKNDEAVVTQYTMTTLEELGLLKMDFLGLRNLTVIHDAQEMIRLVQPDFNISDIPTDDPAIYQMMSTGQTNGVFQFESPGMRQVLLQLHPESLEDLIAVISLYRPGPMESIPRYIQNRHDPSRVTYKTPLLCNILDVTYGCIIYQEQVMQICRELAGYSYGRADLVRRAMAKKKHEVMEQERANFVYGAKKPDGTVECVGAIANGVDEQTANSIFDEMVSFASYAFGKAHAAAYAYLAYQTAWLKCHYPKEYMAALLTSVLDNTDKVTEYIGECRWVHIAVLPPDVSQSGEGFQVEGASIRFGLLAIKNVGRGFIRDLLAARARRPFTDFFDFCERLQDKDLNKRTMEGLIKAGALDCFGHSRKQLHQGYDTVLSEIDRKKRNNLAGQINFFDAGAETGASDSYTLPETDEYERFHLLQMEKEATGQYISGHPLLEHTALIKKLKSPELADVLQSAETGTGRYKDGVSIRVVGIVAAKRLKTTKKEEIMAFIDLEDMTASIETLVFPKLYAQYGPLLGEGSVAVLTGRLSIQEEESPKLVCEKVETLESLRSAKEQAALSKGAKQGGSSGRKGLFLHAESPEDPAFQRAKHLLAVFEGPTPVYVRFRSTGKMMVAPRTLWVDMNDVLERELTKALGEGNVAYLP